MLGCFGMMLLLVVILLYNYCGRKSALLSSALMGLCRVFSFGIGVAAVYPEIPSLNMTLCALYAAGMFLFILGITLVARRETETLKSRPGRTLIPAGALLMAVFGGVWITSNPSDMAHSAGFALLILFLSFWKVHCFSFEIPGRRCSLWQRWTGSAPTILPALPDWYCLISTPAVFGYW